MNLDKSLNKLSERIDRLCQNGSGGRNNDPNYWKGKKIIPLNEWLKVANSHYAFAHGIEHQRTKEALEYFPGDFSRTLLPSGVQENDKELLEKWYADYIELMEYRRNPNYGATKCFRCLLSPAMEDPLSIGINKAIARSLKVLTEDGNSITSPSCPCKVVNIFECPYEKEKVMQNENANFYTDNLFALQKNFALQVELALGHAETMTRSNLETVYEADFQKGVVKEYHADYYGNPYTWFCEYKLEEGLARAKKPSIVPIRSVEDIYRALTEREALDKILEQGLDKEYQKYKNEMVDFFMDIKDKIKIEDLRMSEPVFVSDRVQTPCCICGEFANIHCVNCTNSIWLCTEHWQQHKLGCHG